MEDILSQARKVAEEAEVFWACHEETPVGFESNRLKQLQTREVRGVALRLIKGGRIGFSATTNLVDSQALVGRAVETSQFGAEAKFELPAPRSYPQVETFDPGMEAATIEQMVELGESVIARVRQHTPEILCEAGVVKATSSVRILNSRGGQTGYRRSLFGLSIEGTLIRGTDMLFVGDSQNSCHPITDFEPVAQTVIRQLEMAKSLAPVPTKSLPVLFTPHGVASALISPLALAFDGKVVLEGASPLRGRLGEVVFDKRLSLADDATIAYRPTSHPCDDEGIPAQRTALVEGGVVTGFLYDLQTAGLAGARSTGNGSRSWASLPAPSVSALIIGEGEAAFEDMVQDMKEGLVIEHLMGATQGNLLAGEFSGNVLLGYKVEAGEVVGRVKDTMVSGNVYQALRDLVAIGREARWVGGFLRTPALYCSSLSVASKG
jgi:PmbA protein